MLALASELIQKIKEKLRPAYLVVYQSEGLSSYETNPETKHFEHLHIQIVPTYEGKEVLVRKDVADAHKGKFELGKKWLGQEELKETMELLK